ncbi:MAG: hypothetical protein GXO03_05730 [Aquificae bacterium]|nr:hypothetical protein [Aquificota bacterium]
MQLFTSEDLKKLERALERKIEEVEFWRQYALKKKGRSALEELKEELERLRAFIGSPEAEAFLRKLNDGTFTFVPGEVFFVVNPYFGKARLTYRFPKEAYESRWAARLTADKIRAFLKEQGAHLLQPPRPKVVRELISKLRSLKNEAVLLRGDFKDYTLNVPREALYEQLNSLGLEEVLVRLVRNFLEAGNEVSVKLTRYPVVEFFSKFDEFAQDAVFRAELNAQGVIPGSPLSNVLGQTFLIPFDERMRALAGEEGFYARFLDDFILIVPAERADEAEREVKRLVRKLYRGHPLVERGEEEKLFRLEQKGKLPRPFEFLGYAFKPGGKVSVRYKTLKKFALKYLYEYRFRGPYEPEAFGRYLFAKSAYLHRWCYSFVEVNDKKLLDELTVKFVLPELYDALYAFFKRLEPDARRRKELTRSVFKRLKPYFKLTVIHRLLRKHCRSLSCEEELRRLVLRVREAVEEVFKELKAEHAS